MPHTSQMALLSQQRHCGPATRIAVRSKPRCLLSGGFATTVRTYGRSSYGHCVAGPKGATEPFCRHDEMEYLCCRIFTVVILHAVSYHTTEAHAVFRYCS